MYPHLLIIGAVELLIDTGSSNTWVGSRGGFAGTDNTQDTGNLVVRNERCGRMHVGTLTACTGSRIRFGIRPR